MTEEEQRKEERQWLTLAQNGDSTAFTHMVDKYNRAVFNLCYRMLGNPNDAEDAAQETFLRAYKNIKRYDLNRKFSTWILSIASHYCIDQLRKRRLQTFSMDALPYFELSDGKPGPEKMLVADERQAQVQALLKVLSGKDRAAVIMRYWYDFSYDEIAASLGLTNSAVKSRLHRARRSLAQAWTDGETQRNPGTQVPYGAKST